MSAPTPGDTSGFHRCEQCEPHAGPQTFTCYGTTYTSLQGGFEEWACSRWAHIAHRHFTMPASPDPDRAPRTYVEEMTR